MVNWIFYLAVFICKEILISKLIPIFVGIYFIYLYTYAVLDFPQSIMDLFLPFQTSTNPTKGQIF